VDNTVLATLIAAAIGGVSAITGAAISFLGARRLSIRRETSEATTEQRIARLTTALSESSSVIQEIETEMKDRTELVEKLKRDAETYERLRNINREEAEAVAQALGGELRKEGRRSLLTNLFMNFGFFVLGVATTIALRILFGL
jgi:flagellar biosynthesis/type III secretory pathway M-ring protein FliF/YscJ